MSVCVCVCVCAYQNFLQRADCNTMSIFKRFKATFKSEWLLFHCLGTQFPMLFPQSLWDCVKDAFMLVPKDKRRETKTASSTI